MNRGWSTPSFVRIKKNIYMYIHLWTFPVTSVGENKTFKYVVVNVRHQIKFFFCLIYWIIKKKLKIVIMEFRKTYFSSGKCKLWKGSRRFRIRDRGVIVVVAVFLVFFAFPLFHFYYKVFFVVLNLTLRGKRAT